MTHPMNPVIGNAVARKEGRSKCQAQPYMSHFEFSSDGYMGDSVMTPGLMDTRTFTSTSPDRSNGRIL